MNRDDKFDFYKGLLMFGVLWGHMISNLLGGYPNTIDIHWIIRTYDMPFFMLISGYFLSHSIKKYSFLQICLDKFTTIFIPSVVWSLIGSLGHKIDSYYFLNAVFCSSIIIIFISKIPSKNLQILSALCITLFFHYTQHLSPFNLAYLFPFFALGFFIKERNFKMNNLPSTILALCWIPLLCFWDTGFTIWKARAYLIGADGHLYLIVLFRFAIGICGIAFAKKLFDILYAYFNPLHNWFYRIMSEGGKETLGLYILQEIVIFGIIGTIVDKIVLAKGYNPINFNEGLLGYVFAPVLSLLLMVVFVWFIRITKNNQYTKWIWGQKINILHRKSVTSFTHPLYF